MIVTGTFSLLVLLVRWRSGRSCIASYSIFLIILLRLKLISLVNKLISLVNRLIMNFITLILMLVLSLFLSVLSLLTLKRSISFIETWSSITNLGGILLSCCHVKCLEIITITLFALSFSFLSLSLFGLHWSLTFWCLHIIIFIPKTRTIGFRGKIILINWSSIFRKFSELFFLSLLSLSSFFLFFLFHKFFLGSLKLGLFDFFL